MGRGEGAKQAQCQDSWGTGNVLNLSELKVLVAVFGLLHLIVDAIVIVVVGVSLYALMRSFVFPNEFGELSPNWGEGPRRCLVLSVLPVIRKH